MNHGSHTHNGCIASTADNTPCPGESDPLAVITFHLNSFRNFSTATVTLFAMGAILLLGVAYGLRWRLIGEKEFSHKLISAAFLKELPLPIKEQICYWLSLHENSPATL